jgi:hypothetical protein
MIAIQTLQRAMIAVLFLVPAGVSAQDVRSAVDDPQVLNPSPMASSDLPYGFPYRTGGGQQIAQAQVPLRDFLSSRQDQQYADILGRIDALDRRFQQVIDERDRQYAQRFQAQQEAVQAALQSAKEAVLKAEDSASKRFDSVNEFRQTLSDQAGSFVRKDAADAQFASVNDRMTELALRVNTIQASGQGRSDLVGWIVGVGGVLIALAMLMFNINRTRPPVRGEHL